MVLRQPLIESTVGRLMSEISFSRVAVPTLKLWRSASNRVLVCNVWLVVLLLVLALPSKANAATLRDYTKGVFSFTGYIGLRHEDRRNKSDDNSESRTKSMRTQVQTNLKGFVWDPRFMIFNAGFTNTQQTTETSSGKSEPTTNTFSLFTTWLPVRQYPFVFFINHTVSRISTYSSPTYYLTTDNLGMRWGRSHRTLGIMRFAYDLRMASSSGKEHDRDQVDHQIKIDGKRRLKSRRRSRSDIGYGYRYNNRQGKNSDRTSNEHRFYINDRVTFDPKMSLSADASYTNREDDSNGRIRSLHHLKAKSRLNITKTDRLSLNYNLAMNRTDSDDTASNSLSGGAGANYNISDRWHAAGGVSLAAYTSDLSGSEDRVATALTGGLNYRKPLGIYNFSSSYSISINTTLSGATEGDSINQSFGVGVSQSASSLWMDDIGYTIGVSNGRKRSSISQGLIYRAKSNFSLRDSLRFTAEYRTYSEDGSSSGIDIDRDTNIKKAELNWYHKLGIASTFGASTSYIESENQTVGYSRDSQTTSARLNLRTPIWGQRNLNFVAEARYLDIQGDSSRPGQKITTKLGIGYTIGRWLTSIRHDYYKGDFESQTYENHLITINVKRFFGVRF